MQTLLALPNDLGSYVHGTILRQVIIERPTSFLH